MAVRERIKLCQICNQSVPVLYRVRYQEDGDWAFVCRDCWHKISQDNPFYMYGGTWKAAKVKK
ncbi:MAG: hypothetical protein IGS39_10670 [Calothrix sp. C42_A2020_038]|nr:hypothetical protein [Calothrix sp. C42_A2020_038]